MQVKKIRKILVANRGEIAVRIMRACRELDIATVAVFSDADRLALHARMADEAYHIGPSPSRESYLVLEKIIACAQECGADAIHPGYGFLAENAKFSQKVSDAGLIFIGPSPESIEMMGDKTVARQTMKKAGVPIVPGTEDPLKDETEAAKIAKDVGFPVLLKAAAGGGGKGMRVVGDEKDIASAFRAARSEAESAFGDGRVYVEKYLEGPRHIEFQILADLHGNVIHLGERECSIQRRHQKVIEEAPSVIVDAAMRREMGEAAVKAAQACKYHNAGTIEFMVDKDRNFYFLEMNTRLQVEHPVTELITGLDLVKEQIRVAAGEKLTHSQGDIAFTGHAIECRIYAEDPVNNFLPSTGKIKFMSPPAGPHVRVDGGFDVGGDVSRYYDPLIAKLVVWGTDRHDAVARMKRALREYQIVGVATSIPFCDWVMRHPKFISGDFTTHFIAQEFTKDELEVGDDGEIQAAVLAATFLEHRGVFKKTEKTAAPATNDSRWKTSGRMRQLNRFS